MKRETKVIFRKFKDGDIIAIFPEIPASPHAHDCLSYQIIGEHSSCWPILIIPESSPATPSEYGPIMRVLTHIRGYKLKVLKRYNHMYYYSLRKDELND